MNIVRLILVVALTAVGAGGAAWAEGPDVVTLKDGSVIYGEVQDMVEGKLRIKTTFGVEEIISVKWADVAKLSSTRMLPFVLKEGTTLKGKAMDTEKGGLTIQAEPIATPLPIPLDSIVSINPPVKPPVEFQGNFTLGVSSVSGNSELTNVSGLAELVGRSEKLRLSMFGRYIYGEADGKLTARNSRGTIKLDFFTSKRFFLFTSAYFEQDTFQDLNLRTALSGGPGYQFLEKGDLSSPYTKNMQLYGEFGGSYFNEDFKVQPDKNAFRFRASVKWDWPIIADKVALYHYDEFFPSAENFKDYYLTTDQGVVFNVFQNFVTKFQLTYRYNNNPPAGVKNADTIYLITFGYSLGK